MVSGPAEAVVEVEAAVALKPAVAAAEMMWAAQAVAVAPVAPVQEVPVVRAEAVVSLFSLFSPVERALHRLSRTTSFNAGWVEMGGLEETGVSVACRDSVETEAQTLQMRITQRGAPNPVDPVVTGVPVAMEAVAAVAAEERASGSIPLVKGVSHWVSGSR